MGMLIEQIFELTGPGPSSRICAPIQYLNCKILHGECFCSLDQTHFACESTLVEIR